MSSFESVMSLAIKAAEKNSWIIVERDDGHSSRHKTQDWINWNRPVDPIDSIILGNVCEGPVLDVGCATGKHVEYMRRKNIDAYGMDPCEEAILYAQRKGLDTCLVGDIWKPKDWMKGKFKNLIFMDGAIGIAGTLENLDKFIAIARSLCKPKAKIWHASIDWTFDPQKVHAKRNAQILREGGYPGETKLRIKFNEETSDWFPWLWIAPQDLEKAVNKIGGRSEVVHRAGAKYVGLIQFG